MFPDAVVYTSKELVKWIQFGITHKYFFKEQKKSNLQNIKITDQSIMLPKTYLN